MTENELLLEDRIAKIRSVVEKFGEENFYISYSGGKDSNVLSSLVDLALPGNKMPRVYANTGIELNMIRDFVFDLQKKDDRVQVIKPSVPLKKMLEAEGYPFKSKHHSAMIMNFRSNPENKSAQKYRDRVYEFSSFNCPKKLQYQFDASFTLKISDRCCFRLKEEPLADWSKENNRPYAIIGIMPEEEGRRKTAQCLAFKGKKLKAFQPLVVVTKEWENWFIKEYNVKIPDLYHPPYNFERTGCKGCPFTPRLKKELEALETFFPDERKQCEIIWKPVYDEYRRINYRLEPLPKEHQVTISEWYETIEE